MQSFIETQFPIARLSAESYKERKAGASQTLTGMGKWWGRKPLILVRACIIGMLMPASSDPQRDREIFLKILTMDDDGTWQRCKPAYQRKTTRTAFDKMDYAERIAQCKRPENWHGPSASAWNEINAHLGTRATSLIDLVEQLGTRVFGHRPRVGDSFCGGGSIPFEAARIGCDAYGSDLNPVAALLTWASINLLGGGPEVQQEVTRLQEQAFAAADRQITEWGVEHNNRGERAEVYLYCVEVKPPGCDYYIPLAPSWVISEKYRIVVRWHRVNGREKLEPEVLEVSQGELEEYKRKLGATIVDGRVTDPFDTARTWSMEGLRGLEGLRLWTNEDVVPRPGDLLQERLYCVRWVDKHGTRRYAAPDAEDEAREAEVLALLKERFAAWQQAGYIPSRQIPKNGEKTDEPIRTRGWTHWHHLFTPRQLLILGCYLQTVSPAGAAHEKVTGIIRAGVHANLNSRLCIWYPAKSENEQTFVNQALNTLYNFGTRSFWQSRGQLLRDCQHYGLRYPNQGILVRDAREVSINCDLWITDPPYADAINYHELGDFFLAWCEKQLPRIFPDWLPDARAELAVRGDGDEFRRAMVEIYHNLTQHMPENGLQLVMFTHQDPAVWADLGMILWAAGLRVTAAWTIGTETNSGVKQGNYVQGTVCMVLRRRGAAEPGFLDEVYALVEDEVKQQIASMQALDEVGEPNFNDADYQLAAYAAALKVLTRYSSLDGKDVQRELFAPRAKGEKSDFQAVIERAVRMACDTLIPRGMEAAWRDLSLDERYYFRGLDIESRGERRQGMYEELARGFGVTSVKPLLKSDKANGARMLTPTGFGKALLEPPGGTASLTAGSMRGRPAAKGPHPFSASPTRHLLFAVREVVTTESAETAVQYLRHTFGQDYWSKRELFILLLDWLARLGDTTDMAKWQRDSDGARILAGRLRNDHL